VSAPGPEGEHEGALPWLHGMRVERVDAPFPGLFSITLYGPGLKQHLLLAVEPGRRDVGISPERPKGEAASAYVRRLRTKIEGARLVASRWLGGRDDGHASALELAFKRADSAAKLVADFDGRTPCLVLLADDGRVAGASDEAALRRRLPDRKVPYAAPDGPGIARVASAEELAQRGEALVQGGRTQAVDARKTQARSQLRAALKRATRKAEAIRGDLGRAEQAPRLRREANVILCHLHAIPRGASQVMLVDESVDPAESLALSLDPAQDAHRNAELRFDRARKLERGSSIAAQRLADSTAEVARLEAQLADLESDDPARLEGVLATLGLARSHSAAPAKRRSEPRTHVAYRTFLGSGERRIYVGKGAADNDTLTLTVARPHDHFLHVRGTPGSHVIIPREKNAELPQELLIDAAHLAAHFSTVRGERLVEITHTERRYVRKPKGAPPGSVHVDREKTLLLRVETERLARLLAGEKR
jgi:predicted ribosome quality control (RQC) complex YloA/Tae2 family protein